GAREAHAGITIAFAHRSLAGALDIYENDGTTRWRTAVDRFRYSNHEAEGDAPAHARRFAFIRSEARRHIAALSCVKTAGSAVGSVDAGFGAGSVLTRVWGAAQAQVGDGIGSRCQGESRGSRSWWSGERMSNHRLKLTARRRSVAESLRRT